MNESSVRHRLVTTNATTNARGTGGGEEAITNRIEALKDLSLTISTALEAIGTLEFLGIDQPMDIESGIDFYDEVRRFEIFLIQRALKHTAGCQSRAASLLRLKPTTLNSKIRAYNINWRVPIQQAACRAED